MEVSVSLELTFLMEQWHQLSQINQMKDNHLLHSEQWEMKLVGHFRPYPHRKTNPLHPSDTAV